MLACDFRPRKSPIAGLGMGRRAIDAVSGHRVRAWAQGWTDIERRSTVPNLRVRNTEDLVVRLSIFAHRLASSETLHFDRR